MKLLLYKHTHTENNLVFNTFVSREFNLILRKFYENIFIVIIIIISVVYILMPLEMSNRKKKKIKQL